MLWKVRSWCSIFYTSLTGLALFSIECVVADVFVDHFNNKVTLLDMKTFLTLHPGPSCAFPLLRGFLFRTREKKYLF
jgi:hypothetical protein